MSRRKLTAGLAAGASALALALPAASASAQPHVLPPPYIFCLSLVRQIQFTQFINPLLSNLLSQTFIYTGCGGAAI
jgi:hypothetical protein